MEARGKGRKHRALSPQKPLRLIRDRAVGGGAGGRDFFISNTYSLHCHHQIYYIKVGSCVRHFNVSLIVWAKSQDSVRKPQFWKSKESRSGPNRGPSAYQPSALPARPRRLPHWFRIRAERCSQSPACQRYLQKVVRNKGYMLRGR